MKRLNRTNNCPGEVKCDARASHTQTHAIYMMKKKRNHPEREREQSDKQPRGTWGGVSSASGSHAASFQSID